MGETPAGRRCLPKTAPVARSWGEPPQVGATSLHRFSTLPDPRIERSKHHLLIDIVAIAILATISGAEGWVAIETYGQAKYDWLKQFLELPNGLPYHDTFGRVFANLNPLKFQECFGIWFNSIT
ncbi:MAG: ISAs1 family transposase [Moorea sp. SIO2I5]|nr:ISAs1 family transposase [Moorena sp. SIO2I5]